LSELGATLTQAQEKEQAKTVWAQAERMIGTIEDRERRARSLRELGAALAQAREWAEAERVIDTIKDREGRARALRELGAPLMKAKEHLQLLHLVQRSWQQADTQNYAFALLSLANGLIPLKPEIGNVLSESFSWVDDFLKG
jgi:hypothetical protein